MKRLFQLLILLTFLSACSSKNNFRIEGQLADATFNGEWIYLVPLVNAPVERVDSTIIKGNTFVFEGKVKEPEIYIIRTRPFLRLSLQELLIVKEPGTSYAYIGQNSKANGTALNDSLQHWKEQKELFDLKSGLLQNQLKNAEAVQLDEIRQQQEQLSRERAEYNFSFAKNNSNNVVGEMVMRYSKASFTAAQQKILGID